MHQVRRTHPDIELWLESVAVAHICPINCSVINILINSTEKSTTFPYPGCKVEKGTGMESWSLWVPVAWGSRCSTQTFRNLEIPTLQQWKKTTKTNCWVWKSPIHYCDKCWKKPRSFCERREKTVVPLHHGRSSASEAAQEGCCWCRRFLDPSDVQTRPSPSCQMSEPAGVGLPASDCSGIVLGQLFQSLLFLLGVLSGDDQGVRVSHHHLQRQRRVSIAHGWDRAGSSSSRLMLGGPLLGLLSWTCSSSYYTHVLSCIHSFVIWMFVLLFFC